MPISRIDVGNPANCCPFPFHGEHHPKPAPFRITKGVEASIVHLPLDNRRHPWGSSVTAVQVGKLLTTAGDCSLTNGPSHLGKVRIGSRSNSQQQPNPLLHQLAVQKANGGFFFHLLILCLPAPIPAIHFPIHLPFPTCQRLCRLPACDGKEATHQIPLHFVLFPFILCRPWPKRPATTTIGARRRRAAESPVVGKFE